MNKVIEDIFTVETRYHRLLECDIHYFYIKSMYIDIMEDVVHFVKYYNIEVYHQDDYWFNCYNISGSDLIDYMK